MSLDVHFCKTNKNTKDRQVLDWNQIKFLPYSFYKDYDGYVKIDITREQVCDVIDRCKEYLDDNSKTDLLMPDKLADVITTDRLDITPDYVIYALEILENKVLPEFDTLGEDEVITFDAWE